MNIEDRVTKLEDTVKKILSRLEKIEKLVDKNPIEGVAKSAKPLSAPIPTGTKISTSVSKSVSAKPIAPIPKPASKKPVAPIPKPFSTKTKPKVPVEELITPASEEEAPIQETKLSLKEPVKKQITKQALPRGGATSQIKAKKGIFTCPQCDSDYYEELEDKSKPLYTMGPGTAIYSKKLRCWNCGHEWPKPSS